MELPADGDTSADDEELPPNWIDSSHTVAADSAQALVEWMDDFFGDPSYDLEKAESFLRLELEHEWEEGEGNDFGVRIRGKVQLPKISRRVDLVFSDDDGADPGGTSQQDRDDADSVALQLKVREGNRSRFDATLGYSSGNLKPGVRYRNEGGITESSTYRYIQRFLYEDGEGFLTRGKLDLYRAVNESSLFRLSGRIKYGERTDGVEWTTSASYSQRWYEETRRPLAVAYFVSVGGRTRPEPFDSGYTIGTQLRRQMYRDFLFFEIEPTYNISREAHDDSFGNYWSIVMRLEIHLARDLVKRRKNITEKRETRRAERRLEPTDQPQ